MKTAEEIKNEYVDKIKKYAKDEDDKKNVDKDGNPRDRGKTINVTDICSWDTYCPRQVYYNKVVCRPNLPSTLMRFRIGHLVHEIPLWDEKENNGHEQAFTWKGIKCRMDEINFEDGIIVDKKTSPSLPSRPKDYVVKQLNIYKIIAEENEERPTKVKQLFVINICVVNGKVQALEVPIWPPDITKEFVERVVKNIKYHIENNIAPAASYDGTSWLCEGCQYTDMCKRNLDIPCELIDEKAVEALREGITVKRAKK